MIDKQGKASIDRWQDRLQEFLPTYFDQAEALRSLWGQCDVVLHGSTTRGIDDEFSDLDVWVIAPADLNAIAEHYAGTRFFSFTLNGKKGHFNLEDQSEAEHWLQGCDLEKIAELRSCRILSERLGVATSMADAARKPMRPTLSRAWFFHYYVEMRSWHRNCDNPIERGDSLAVLQALVPTVNHALRAAMVLGGEPYPYIKWLGQAAGSTPTGRRLLPLVQAILDRTAEGSLHLREPEASHPISLLLRDIRCILIGQAAAQSIEEPWLERWWDYIVPARTAITDQTW